MNTTRNVGQRRGGATVVDNQVLPQAPSKGVAMLVNPTWLTDAEVRVSLDEMAQVITVQDQSMTV